MQNQFGLHTFLSQTAHNIMLPASSSVVATVKAAATADTQVNQVSGVTSSNCVRVWFDGAAGVTKLAIRLNGAAAPTISAAATLQVGTICVVGAAGTTVTFICDNGEYITGISHRTTSATGNVYVEFYKL